MWANLRPKGKRARAVPTNLEAREGDPAELATWTQALNVEWGMNEWRVMLTNWCDEPALKEMEDTVAGGTLDAKGIKMWHLFPSIAKLLDIRNPSPQ